MKFKVSMKDPDTLSDAVREAVAKQVGSMPDIAADEKELLVETRVDKVYHEACEKWFEYGEYLTVEIDTDAGTCVVVPV